MNDDEVVASYGPPRSLFLAVWYHNPTLTLHQLIFDWEHETSYVGTCVYLRTNGITILQQKLMGFKTDGLSSLESVKK